jgi:hypothetical protein
LVPSDELSFALWKAEAPHGMVASDMAAYVPEYAPKNWDVRMRKAPAVLSYREQGMEQRDLVLGIAAFGSSRAFLYDAVLHEKLVMDHVGPEPVMIAMGPDNESVRVFRRRIPAVKQPVQFYRTANEEKAPLETAVQSAMFMDDATGSGWNFQGCAVSGKSKGICLERMDAVKDYWFDWRHYHADTSLYPGARH